MSKLSDLFFYVAGDILDLDFTISDLNDIELSESEITESAYFDSLASETVRENKEKKIKIPIGKLVL